MIQLRIMTGTANVRTIKMKTKTMMMTCAAKSKLKDAPKPLRAEPQSANFATMTLSEVRKKHTKKPADLRVFRHWCREFGIERPKARLFAYWRSQCEAAKAAE